VKKGMLFEKNESRLNYNMFFSFHKSPSSQVKDINYIYPTLLTVLAEYVRSCSANIYRKPFLSCSKFENSVLLRHCARSLFY